VSLLTKKKKAAFIVILNTYILQGY